MRRDLPYEFELVPIKNGISITNVTTWNQRDLVVSCTGNNETVTVMSGTRNHCLLAELPTGRTYSIRISRADLKGRLLYRPFKADITVVDPPPEYVVLVGASVGKGWDLPSLPSRSHFESLVLGCRVKYGYDKSDVLERIAATPVKPDKVIIKECAAYMPQELEKIMRKLPVWVDLMEDNGITPILATCCPVTVSNDRDNPGRQRAIETFNRFVRDYAAEHDLQTLDLDHALRISDTNHYLREDYAQTDGLHISAEGYSALDQELLATLGLHD